jgi:hypothetical protein
MRRTKGLYDGIALIRLCDLWPWRQRGSSVEVEPLAAQPWADATGRVFRTWEKGWSLASATAAFPGDVSDPLVRDDFRRNKRREALNTVLRGRFHRR